MKTVILAIALIATSSSAFAANASKQLCEKQAQKALLRLFDNNKNVSVESVDEYTEGKNMEGTDVVQYAYNIRSARGSSYARVTLAKKGCKFLVGSAAASKQAMEDDDRDAAQLGGQF